MNVIKPCAIKKPSAGEIELHSPKKKVVEVFKEKPSKKNSASLYSGEITDEATKELI